MKKRMINIMMINCRKNILQTIICNQLRFLQITNIYVEYKEKNAHVHMVLKTTNNPAKNYWSEVAVSYPVLFIPSSEPGAKTNLYVQL